MVITCSRRLCVYVVVWLPMQALVECCYILEDYAGLEKLVRMLPEGAPLLVNIGKKFQTVGITEQAVAALLKANDIKGAIDCCVLLNQWDKAVELAEAHRFPQVTARGVHANSCGWLQGRLTHMLTHAHTHALTHSDCGLAGQVREPPHGEWQDHGGH